MWTAIGTIAALLLAVFAWWVKANDAGTKEKDRRKKEIEDAVKSKDVSRIHAVIDGVRHQ